MLRTSLVSAVGNLLKKLMPCLLWIGLGACGEGSGNDTATLKPTNGTATLKATLTTASGAVTLANSALVQCYAYPSQFGTFGCGNGQCILKKMS